MSRMTSWKEWCPDEAIEELTLKRALQEVEDPIKMTNDLFRDALPLVAMGMTHLAIHEPNPGIRFNAQKYVIDRSMGSVNNPTRPVDDRPAWEKIFDSVVVEAQKPMD